MTYLQLINKVLRELREKQVVDLSNEYTQLIGQYVNEAKEDLEAAIEWQCLRTNITWNTVIGQSAYLLANTNERSRLVKDVARRPMVFNLQGNAQYQLNDVGLEYYNRQINMPNGNEQGQPSYVVQSRTVNGLTVRLWEYPDAVYPFLARVVVPQAELQAAGDVITIPSRPVWLLAALYAASERTEGLGIDLRALEARAQRAATDAISFDQEPEEIDFKSI